MGIVRKAVNIGLGAAETVQGAVRAAQASRPENKLSREELATRALAAKGLAQVTDSPEEKQRLQAIQDKVRGA